MAILNVRIYDGLDEVRAAQKRHERLKDEKVLFEYFYQKISDQYGEAYPRHVDSLIEALPGLLNIDDEQLTLDESGLAIVDEAIKWNHDSWQRFDDWFPAVLAYYGTFYIKHKGKGKWESVLDKEHNIWVPQITLADGTSAFDMRDFYKDLAESPIPIKWAGDYDGWKKEMRNDN